VRVFNAKTLPRWITGMHLGQHLANMWGPDPLVMPLQEISLKRVVEVAEKIRQSRSGKKPDTPAHPPQPTPTPPIPGGTILPHPEEKIGPASAVHVVQKRDTLFGIAKRHYRDAAKYQRLVQANPSLSAIQPHLQLPIGAPLVIP
jgi:nucleoid-associated protein YgaU